MAIIKTRGNWKPNYRQIWRLKSRQVLGQKGFFDDDKFNLDYDPNLFL